MSSSEKSLFGERDAAAAPVLAIAIGALVLAADGHGVPEVR